MMLGSKVTCRLRHRDLCTKIRGNELPRSSGFLCKVHMRFHRMALLTPTSYYEQILSNQYAKLVCWVDTAYEAFRDTDYSILPPEAIDKAEFDYAVIASWNDDNAMVMKSRLLSANVPEEKIIWVK